MWFWISLALSVLIIFMGCFIKAIFSQMDNMITELSSVRSDLQRQRQANGKLQSKIKQRNDRAVKRAKKPKGPNISKFGVAE